MAFVSEQEFSDNSDNSDSDRSSSPEADDPNYALSGPHIHNEMTLESKWPYSKVFGSSCARTCPQVIETTSDHVCFLVRSIPEPEGKFYSLGVDTVGHKHNHVLLFQFVLVSDWSHSRFQTKDYIVHITLQDPHWLNEKFLRVEQVEEWDEIAKKENVTFLMNLKYNVDHDFICHEPGHVRSVSCRLAKKRFKKCPPITRMSLDNRLLPTVTEDTGTFPGMQKVRDERGEQNTALVRLPPFDTLLKKQHIGELVRNNVNWLMSNPSSMKVDQSFFLNPGSLIRDGRYVLPMFSRLAGQINASCMPQEFAMNREFQGSSHHLLQAQRGAQASESLLSTSYDTGVQLSPEAFISRLTSQISASFRPQEFAANQSLKGATNLLQSHRGTQEIESLPSTSYGTGVQFFPETIITRLAGQISASFRPQEFTGNHELQGATHHLLPSQRGAQETESIPSTSYDTEIELSPETIISRLAGQISASFRPQEFAANREQQGATHHLLQSQRGVQEIESLPSNINDTGDQSPPDTIISRPAGHSNCSFMPQKFAADRETQGITHHLPQSKRKAREIKNAPSTSYDIRAPSSPDTIFSRLSGQPNGSFKLQEFASNCKIQGVNHHLSQSKRKARDIKDAPSTSYDTRASTSPDTIFSRLSGQRNDSLKSQEFASNYEIQGVTYHLTQSKRKSQEIEEVPSTSHNSGDPSNSDTNISRLAGQIHAIRTQEFAQNRGIHDITHRRQPRRKARKKEDVPSSSNDTVVPSTSDTIFSRLSVQPNGSFRPQKFIPNSEIQGVTHHHLQSQRAAQEIDSLPFTINNIDAPATSGTIFSRFYDQITCSFRPQEFIPNLEIQGVTHHLPQSQRGARKKEDPPPSANDARGPSTLDSIFSRLSAQPNDSFKPQDFASNREIPGITHHLPRSKRKVRDIKDVPSTSYDIGGLSTSGAFISRSSGQFSCNFRPHEFPLNRELQAIIQHLQSERGSQEIDDVPPSSSDAVPSTSSTIFSRMSGQPNASFKPQEFASNHETQEVTNNLTRHKRKSRDIKDLPSTSYDTGGTSPSDTLIYRFSGQFNGSFRPHELAPNRELQGIIHHLHCHRGSQETDAVPSSSNEAGAASTSDTIVSRSSSQQPNASIKSREFASNREIQEVIHHLQCQRESQEIDDVPTSSNDAGAPSSSHTIFYRFSGQPNCSFKPQEFASNTESQGVTHHIPQSKTKARDIKDVQLHHSYDTQAPSPPGTIFSRLSGQPNVSFRPQDFAPNCHHLQSQRGSRDMDNVPPSSNDSGVEDAPLDLKKVSHPPAAPRLPDVPYPIPQPYSWVPNWSNPTPSTSALNDTSARVPTNFNVPPPLPQATKTHRPPVRRRTRRRIIITCGDDRFVINSKILEDASPVVKAFMTYWTPLPDPNGDIYLEISGVTSIALENLLKYLTHDSVNRGVMRSTHMKELTRKLKIDLNYT